MSLRLIAKFSLVLSLFLTQYAYANVITNIACPPSSVVPPLAAKIDTAILFDKAYIAGSSVYAYNENGINWRVATALNANSKKQAIQLGQEAVKKVSYGKSKVAVKSGQLMYCNYGPTEVWLETYG